MSAARLSLVALWLGFAAAAYDWFLIIAPQEDKSEIRWWLSLAPLVLVPLPVVIPRHLVRIACAVVMSAWVWVAMFSLGPAFIPCLVVMWIAARASAHSPQEQHA